MINHLKGLYERLPNGEIKNISVQRAKSLNYFGVDFGLSTKEQVVITLSRHINNVIKEFSGKLRNL